MLEIAPRALREMREHAEQGYPDEICGIGLGVSLPDGGRRLEAVIRARNLDIDRAHDRYELDPRAFLEADDRARDTGREVIAVYHTHPDHPAEPSETDRSKAWEGWSYIIVSVRDGAVADVRSWRLAGEAFEEESIAALTAGSPPAETT